MPRPVQTWRRLPRAARFLLCHAAIGFPLAAIFVGGLVLTDPNGTGTVLLTAADHWWPVAALWGLTGLTFGAAQMGAAMMLLDDREDGRPRGTGAPVPVRLSVRAARR